MVKTEERLGDVGLGYDGLLLCPRCHGEYLHHSRVDIYDRSEDAGTGTHVVAGVEFPRTDGDMAGNPSARRHGLTVWFWCEFCDSTADEDGAADTGEGIVLHIVQHKGCTYLSWERVES